MFEGAAISRLRATPKLLPCHFGTEKEKRGAKGEREGGEVLESSFVVIASQYPELLGVSQKERGEESKCTGDNAPAPLPLRPAMQKEAARMKWKKKEEGKEKEKKASAPERPLAEEVSQNNRARHGSPRFINHCDYWEKRGGGGRGGSWVSMRS